MLERQDEVWRVEQAGGYPADKTKVDKLLDDLEQAKVRRAVVTSSRYHETLKVTEKENERRVRVWEAGKDDPAIDLVLGSSPNYGVNHVRRIGENPVYEVRGLSPWSMQADSGAWIDKQLLDIEADDVTELTLRNEHGEIVLGRREDGWVVLGDESAAVDSSKIDSFVRSAGGLRFDRPAAGTDDTDYGLDDPAATLELVYAIDDATSESVLARIGGAAGEDGDQRYAQLDGSEYVVILSKWDADRLLDQKLEDFFVDDEPASGR